MILTGAVVDRNDWAKALVGLPVCTWPAACAT